jgi:hypothetical protein
MAFMPLDVVDHGGGHRPGQTHDAEWMRPQMGEPVYAPTPSVEGWSFLDRVHTPCSFLGTDAAYPARIPNNKKAAPAHNRPDNGLAVTKDKRSSSTR